MRLRPYQSEGLDAVRLALVQGCNRQLIVLPTASGKTVVFSQLPTALRIRRPDKMLVLVQADELCHQSVRKLKSCNPTLKVGLEKAQYKSAPDDDIVVASIQTLGGTKMGEDGIWKWGKRLLTLDPEAFRYIVVDEAHHITASNYHGALRYFRVMKSEEKFNDTGKFLLGVTATPNRSDNKGLEGFFEKIVFSRDIRTMIKEKWLAPLEAHRVDTMVDISHVDVRRGKDGADYVTSQLEEAINTPERNNLIVQKYLELGEGSPFLAFTCDIRHTVDLTNAFRARGVACFGIASKQLEEPSEWLITKENERKQAIERYEAGEFTGLISCQALLEGFDAPRATVGLGGAPTASPLRFTQGVGRILRPFPAPEAEATWTGWRKRAAIWIDFCDNTVKNSLITAPTLMGLRANFNAKGKALVEIVEEIERLKASKPALNMHLYTDLDAIKGIAERIDLFAVPQIDPEVAKYSQLSWTTGMTEGAYQLSLPDKGMLTIKVSALGEYEISKHITGIKTPLGVAKDLAAALKIADKAVPQEAMILLRSDSGWRTLPVTPQQLGLLKRLYPEMRSPFNSDQEFYNMIQAQYSRGQVSQLLSVRDTRGRPNAN